MTATKRQPRHQEQPEDQLPLLAAVQTQPQAPLSQAERDRIENSESFKRAAKTEGWATAARDFGLIE